MGLPLGLRVPDSDALPLGDGVPLGLGEAVSDGDGVAVLVPDCEGVWTCDADRVPVELPVACCDGLCVSVADPEGVPTCVPLRNCDGVTDSERIWVLVNEGDGDAETEGDVLCEPVRVTERDTSCEREPEGDGLVVSEADELCEVVTLCDPEPTWVPVLV